MEAFLSRTYYSNGAYNNCEGMSKLNAQMDLIEANRMFYLSVPQEAVLDVSSCIANKAQSQKGWSRVIIEKPFGLDVLSSSMLTRSLLSKFEEKQIYRIDHLLGRNLIENLTVLRFSNLVFEPLWSRNYVRSVQVILSEKLNARIQGRYSAGYGVICDLIHSHVLQTVALLAMEPPVSLDGEDIQNEKVKVLRSIRKLEPSDAILGQYKPISEDHHDVTLNSLAPTFFAAALYIDNARWDGVPFLIRAGTGLIGHRINYKDIVTTMKGDEDIKRASRQSSGKRVDILMVGDLLKAGCRRKPTPVHISALYLYVFILTLKWCYSLNFAYTN